MASSPASSSRSRSRVTHGGGARDSAVDGCTELRRVQPGRRSRSRTASIVLDDIAECVPTKRCSTTASTRSHAEGEPGRT
jgi:hypothetical protein